MNPRQRYSQLHTSARNGDSWVRTADRRDDRSHQAPRRGAGHARSVVVSLLLPVISPGPLAIGPRRSVIPYLMRILPPAAAAAALTLAAGPKPAGADQPKNIQPHEWAMVPVWCPNAGASLSVQGNRRDFELAKVKDPDVRAKIVALDRSGCNGYHHYCYGLLWSNRAYLSFGVGDHSQDSYYFTNAIGDFEYVLGQSQPSCSLRPDIYTKIGEIQSQLGKQKEAEASYAKALEIKRGYPMALVGLSDLFEARGETAKSIAVLREGLKINPQSTALKKKLQRLEARTAQPTNPP